VPCVCGAQARCVFLVWDRCLRSMGVARIDDADDHQRMKRAARRGRYLGGREKSARAGQEPLADGRQYMRSRLTKQENFLMFEWVSAYQRTMRMQMCSRANRLRYHLVMSRFAMTRSRRRAVSRFASRLLMLHALRSRATAVK
jgi:hypothetical protein